MNRAGVLLILLLAPLTVAAMSTTDIPVGSVIVLNKEVINSANSAKVYFQSGQEMREQQVSRSLPHCYIEVKKMSGTPQTLAPGKFRITRVRHDRDVFTQTLIFYLTEFRVDAPAHPNVRAIYCAIRGGSDEPRDTQISVADMRAAFGDFATLILGSKGK